MATCVWVSGDNNIYLRELVTLLLELGYDVCNHSPEALDIRHRNLIQYYQAPKNLWSYTPRRDFIVDNSDISVSTEDDFNARKIRHYEDASHPPILSVSEFVRFCIGYWGLMRGKRAPFYGPVFVVDSLQVKSWKPCSTAYQNSEIQKNI